MENNYTQQERVAICSDIATNLKQFENAKGEKVNLFNETYSFVLELKRLFNEYIHNEISLKGSLDFVEIGKKIDYYLPLYKKHQHLFVIRIKNKKK